MKQDYSHMGIFDLYFGSRLISTELGMNEKQALENAKKTDRLLNRCIEMPYLNSGRITFKMRRAPKNA